MFKEALHPFKKKYHREFYALKDIDLTLQKGEILGIVGKNGSGKSTLLKIISGVLPTTKGSVKVSGEIVALLELGAGFNPNFTGIENIFFYGSIMGYKRHEIVEKLEEIIAFADIGVHIDQPVKTYSTGMKARLAFSVSTHIDPDILILDEVLSVGDELFRRKCYARMEEFFSAGKTILYVSHNANSVNQLCTRAILLHGGRLIMDGQPKEVTSYYHKLLYAKGDKSGDILKEIKESGPQKDRSDRIEEKTVKKKPVSHRNLEKKEKAIFIKGFEPISKVVLKNCDVDIEDVHIRCLDGKRVNSLIIGDEYIYSYMVIFNVSARNVIFGMKFKTEKGLEIEGAAEPGLPGTGRYIDAVEKGETYRVDWFFKCQFMPGNYYPNAGVYGIVDGFEGILHRIIDSMVFKVQDIPTRNFSGLTHIYSKVEISAT
jgi:lipopolysaccharide transport system ATP-binding protein